MAMECTTHSIGTSHFTTRLRCLSTIEIDPKKDSETHRIFRTIAPPLTKKNAIVLTVTSVCFYRKREVCSFNMATSMFPRTSTFTFTSLTLLLHTRFRARPWYYRMYRMILHIFDEAIDVVVGKAIAPCLRLADGFAYVGRPLEYGSAKNVDALGSCRQEGTKMYFKIKGESREGSLMWMVSHTLSTKIRG